ncbi:MAG TPA: phosphate ABC transporter substrate-binding protein [Rhodocyclaceae bacterium]
MDPRRRGLLLGLGGLGAAAAGGAWWAFGTARDNARPALLIAGASAMLKLNQALAQGYAKLNSKLDIVVEQGGSLPGLIALKRGAIDIAAMSRDLEDAEDDALTRSYLVAKNEIAIAVHPDSPLRNLSRAQVRAVFAGEIRNWNTLGGPSGEIRVISRKPDSSSRLFVQEVVLAGDDIRLDAHEADSAADAARLIAADPHAIGFIGLKDRDATPLNYLAVDGVAPVRTTVLSGRYPFSQPLHLVLYGEANRDSRAFVEFAMSSAGQAIVAAQHLIPVA